MWGTNPSLGSLLPAIDVTCENFCCTVTALSIICTKKKFRSEWFFQFFERRSIPAVSSETVACETANLKVAHSSFYVYMYTFTHCCDLVLFTVYFGHLAILPVARTLRGWLSTVAALLMRVQLLIVVPNGSSSSLFFERHSIPSVSSETVDCETASLESRPV